MDTTLNLTHASTNGYDYKETGTYQPACPALLELCLLVVLLPFFQRLFSTLCQYMLIWPDTLCFHFELNADIADVIDTVVHNKTPDATKLNKLDDIESSSCKVVRGTIKSLSFQLAGINAKRFEVDVFEKGSNSSGNKLFSISHRKIEKLKSSESESSMQILSNILKNITQVSPGPATRVDKPAVTCDDKPTDVSPKEVTATKADGRILENNSDLLQAGSTYDVEVKGVNCQNIASVSSEIECDATDDDDGWMDLSDQ